MYKLAFRIVIYTILTIFLIMAVYPLIHIIITSLKSADEYVNNKLSLPKQPTLENYQYVLIQGKMLRYFLNSLILMVPSLAVYLFVCNAAGFAFGRLRFPFRLPIFLAVLFLMIFPQMLLSIQIFQVCRSLHLINNYIGLILVWIAYFAPFGTYIMTTYYSTVPLEIVESARMDGANNWQILFRIMIPIAKPMLAIIIIIGFQSMWNELPFSLLLLQKESLRTITQGIGMMKGQYGLDDTILTTAVMVASIVPLVLFIFFQKYITMGAYAGSVKG